MFADSAWGDAKRCSVEGMILPTWEVTIRLAVSSGKSTYQGKKATHNRCQLLLSAVTLQCRF